MVPEWFPEPGFQEATVTGAVLLMVPATNPVPDGVHVTLLMGMVSVPEVKSPPVCALKVAVLEPPVFTLAVIPTVAGLDGIDGTSVGSASAKEIAAVFNVSFAVALTVALMVKGAVASAPKATPAANMHKTSAIIKILPIFIHFPLHP
jgi:hypothetical protein